jgi:hypothetical protein
MEYRGLDKTGYRLITNRWGTRHRMIYSYKRSIGAIEDALGANRR